MRSAEAQSQVDAAREEPEIADVPWAGSDAQLMYWVNQRWPGCSLLIGDESVAYKVLVTAAHRAHAAQQTMAATGATLREAIQGLCAAIAPGERP